jgi:integrase
VRRGFKLGCLEDPPLVYRQPAIAKLAENNVRQGFLEQDQYEDLLEELPANLKALFVCGYHVGARKNELRHIQWPQVDFESGLIRLSGGQTKNKQPRTLPIYGDMRRWLEHQRETCPAGSPWVFHGKHGCPVDNHLNGWAEACERAGVPGLLFHDLRRSAVRNMKRAGIQDVEAMRISGHRTRAIFDRYNIVDEADLASAGKRLEEYAQRRKQERAARLRRVK